MNYDRDAAVRYAQDWALSRNPKYADFHTMGGDCTNFVSQCLYAGGHEMNFTPVFGWYYISLNERTPSWTGVEQFFAFVTQNEGAGPSAEIARIDELVEGDVIQLGNGLRWYHTLLVTGLYPEIVVCAHDFDALNRPLSTYTALEMRGLHIRNQVGD